MRRFTLSVVLAGAMLASSLSFAMACTSVAPADEYFGQMKMSILEINNRLRDLTGKADRQSAPPQNIEHDAEFTESAMHDWESKYPRDPWLPRSVARLVHIYSHIDTGASKSRMHGSLRWLQRRYARHSGLVSAMRVEVAIADAHLHNLSRR